MDKKIIFWGFVCILWFIVYMRYGLSWPAVEVQSELIETPIVTGFEAQLDYELQTQKNLYLAKYELTKRQAELQKELARITQNTDINESAIRTAQSRLNDKYKEAIYTGSAF